MAESGIMIEFSEKLAESNPERNAVLIIGQKKLLSLLPYEDVKSKFSGTVSREVYEKAIAALSDTSSGVVPLYLKCAILGNLSSICSRHNTPSQAHAITKLVKDHTSSGDEYVVIACPREHVLASACAVARAYPLYNRKEERPTNKKVTVEFVVMGSDGRRATALSQSELECLAVAAEGVRLAARISDMPCCEMNTDAFVEEIKKVGESLGIKAHVICGNELEKQGFGGIYGVGKAANHPPALAVLSHTPEGATETVAWVGKGIVYDTGGLSIKGRVGMCSMKRDCAGAAGILGAFYLAVKMGFKENLHAIFCLAENAVGPSAQRPDDIVTMYSGKTVEINNTDAEGRLVLGDGVVYAKKDLKATTIVDMATLTGAQGKTTGKNHGAVLSNSEKWETAAVVAGKASGDLVHPIVYCPEILFSEFNSQIADMKNSVADYDNANSTCAGLFVLAQIGFDFEGDWIHIDMCYPAMSNGRCTGFGVALLGTMFGHLSNNKLLQELSPKNI